MHVNRGLLGWGVFFIALGAVPLAVRGGYVDADTVRHAWELWPLILVGIGLGLLLQRTRFAAVGGILVALTFGLIGGSVLAVGVSGGFGGCGVGAGSSGAQPFQTRSGAFEGSATVSLDMSCGEVAATSAAGAGWSVAGTGNDAQAPSIGATGDRLEVRSPEHSGFGVLGTGQRWQVVLPNDPTLREVDLSLNAGSATVDLAGAHVTAASVSVNAGDARLDLSGALGLSRIDGSANAGALKVSLPAASVTGSLSANAGSVDVCVPEGVGIRLQASNNPLSGNNFASRGLVQDGSTWTSPGYDSASTHIDLEVSANVGAVNLNPEAGCD